MTKAPNRLSTWLPLLSHIIQPNQATWMPSRSTSLPVRVRPVLQCFLSCQATLESLVYSNPYSPEVLSSQFICHVLYYMINCHFLVCFSYFLPVLLTTTFRSDSPTATTYQAWDLQATPLVSEPQHCDWETWSWPSHTQPQPPVLFLPTPEAISCSWMCS